MSLYYTQQGKCIFLTNTSVFGLGCLALNMRDAAIWWRVRKRQILYSKTIRVLCKCVHDNSTVVFPNQHFTKIPWSVRKIKFVCQVFKTSLTENRTLSSGGPFLKNNAYKIEFALTNETSTLAYNQLYKIKDAMKCAKIRNNVSDVNITDLFPWLLTSFYVNFM